MLPSSPHHNKASDFQDAPRWLTLWLPFTLVTVAFLTAAQNGEFYWSLFNGEHSVTENSTVIVLLVAVTYGIRTLLLLRGQQASLLFIWVLVGSLGCIYFAGEEASWGQWLFQWTTPEGWQQFNDQDETNLHNMTGYGYLLDQLPRALLTLGAFVGGICAPLWLRLRRQTLNPQRYWYWIWPTAVTLPVAFLGVFISSNSQIILLLQGMHWLPSKLGAGEFKELYLGWFLMIYMLSLHIRLRQLLANASHA